MIKSIVNFIKTKIFGSPAETIKASDVLIYVATLEKRVEALHTLMLKQSELLRMISGIQYNLADYVYGVPSISFVESENDINQNDEAGAFETIILASIDDDEFMN